MARRREDHGDVWDAIRAAASSIDKLSGENRKLSREVGKVANGLGYFAEGLVGPSLPRVLGRAGLKVSHWSFNAESHSNGDAQEFDLLAVGSRTEAGTPVVVVVEVSNQLTADEVGNCLEKVSRFFEFFPEYRSHELVAGVAAMKVLRDVARHAQRQGLFVLGPGEEFARGLNSPGFVPKVWRAAP